MITYRWRERKKEQQGKVRSVKIREKKRIISAIVNVDLSKDVEEEGNGDGMN